MTIIEQFKGNTGQAASLSILRLDLPDPLSGGNKSFKLKYNLEEMKRNGFSKLLTFGGAFSNHIAAVATSGKNNGFDTIGIIRGEELNENSNSVLKYAAQCGMKLIFISREDYRKRNEVEFREMLLDKSGPAYFLPEGGSNEFAVKGCKEILSEETNEYDCIICPVGTGATLSGIIAGAKAHQQILGVAVLNGREYLEKEISALLKNENVSAEWKLNHDFTFGGYAQTSATLENFIIETKEKHDLPLDSVYSGKTFFAISEISKGDIFRGKHLLFIHTGGYAFSNL